MLDGEEDAALYDGAFSAKPAYQRFLILAAGPMMNFVVGVVLSVLLTAGASSIAGTVVAQFDANALSPASGLRTGDMILAVGNDKVYSAMDFGLLLIGAEGKPVTLTVERAGEKLVLQNVIFPVQQSGDSIVALPDFYFSRIEKTPLQVLKHGLLRSYSFCRVVWKSIFSMVTGHISIRELSGPVGTTAAMGNAARAGGEVLILFVVFFTINLGIVNLLPFPALDGGRILFLCVEKVIGRPLPASVESACNAAGFALLMILMIYITFQDIIRLALG